MIDLKQIQDLYETGMESMPAAEKALIRQVFFDEQKPFHFMREHGMKKKEFASLRESALGRLKEYLRSVRINGVWDVF